MSRPAFVLALALAALPAAAQAESAGRSDARNVAVNGRVAPVCVLGAPSRATVDLGQLSAGSGARTGRVAVLASQSVSFPGSYCNFAGTTVRVDATALVDTDTSTLQPGFARAVNYTATASGWTGTPSGATTAALRDGTSATTSGTGGTQPLPNLANIGVTLSNFSVPGDQLLMSGPYRGTVVVTLGPAASPE